MGKITIAFSKVITWLIRIYQFLISPWLGNCCRFYPSCSSYAITAVHTHGNLRGCYLTLKRLCRCHPWHPGGIDFVPERKPT